MKEFNKDEYIRPDVEKEIMRKLEQTKLEQTENKVSKEDMPTIIMSDIEYANLSDKLMKIPISGDTLTGIHLTLDCIFDCIKVVADKDIPEYCLRRLLTSLYGQEDYLADTVKAIPATDRQPEQPALPVQNSYESNKFDKVLQHVDILMKNLAVKQYLENKENN